MDRRQFLAAAAALWPAAALAEQGPIVIIDHLHGKHPAEYYKAAMEVFRDGDREAGVIILYLGQLRYRTHLSARTDLPRSGDPALFASLSESIGRPINEWAFGDIPNLLKIIRDVLAHDEKFPDPFTPPQQFPAAHKSARDGLANFRRQIAAQADDIRKQRAANGLENRRGGL